MIKVLITLPVIIALIAGTFWLFYFIIRSAVEEGTYRAMVRHSQDEVRTKNKEETKDGF